MSRWVFPFFFTLSLGASLAMPEIFKTRTLKILAPDFLGKKILRPPNTKILLLQSDDYCLTYRTPPPENPDGGKILWGKNCGTGPGNTLEEIPGVGNFSFNYSLADGIGTLDIGFSQNEKHWTPSFVLPGLTTGGRKPYGLFFGQEENLMGGPGDSYKEGTALACHRVDGACRDVLPNRCHLCRYGYFEVVDYSCPQGGTKFCGLEQCGMRGHPACGLGLSWVHGVFKETPCRDNSPAGFCLAGLHQVCDENNILICL